MGAICHDSGNPAAGIAGMIIHDDSQDLCINVQTLIPTKHVKQSAGREPDLHNTEFPPTDDWWGPDLKKKTLPSLKLT